MSEGVYLFGPSIAAFAAVVFFAWGLLSYASSVIGAEEGERGRARAAFVSRDPILELSYPILVACAPLGRWVLENLGVSASVRRNLARMNIHEEEMDVGLMGGICVASGLGAAIFLAILAGLFGFAWVGVVALAPGFYLPLSLIESYGHERQVDIARRYPFYLDLVSLAMKAGATFRQATEIFVRDNSGIALSDELRVMLDLMDRGKTEDEALSEFARRVEEPEVAVSVNTILQGEELGTPLAALIAHQGQLMRHGRVRKASKMAEEAAVRMTGPTTVIMIASLLLIIGPMLIDAANSGVF